MCLCVRQGETCVIGVQSCLKPPPPPQAVAAGILGDLSPEQLSELQAAHAAETAKSSAAAFHDSQCDHASVGSADSVTHVKIDSAVGPQAPVLAHAAGMDSSAFNAFNAFSFGAYLHTA